MDHISVSTTNTPTVLHFKIRAAQESDLETIVDMIGEWYSDRGEEYPFDSNEKGSIAEQIFSDGNRSISLFLLEPLNNFRKAPSFKLKFKPITLHEPIKTVESSSSSSSKEEAVGLVLLSRNFTTLEALPGFSIQHLIAKYEDIGLENLLVDAVVAQAKAMGYGRVDQYMPIDPEQNGSDEDGSDEDGSKLGSELGVNESESVYRFESYVSKYGDIHLSTPEHFKIRRAVQSDAKVVNQLIQEMAESKGLKDQCSATEEAIADTIFSDDESFVVLLLEVSKGFFVNADQPVTDTSESSANEHGVMAIGFVLLSTTFSTYTMEPGFFIEDLFVRSDYEGMELKKHLVSHVLAEAKRMAYEKMELVTTYSKINAKKLKKDLGFEYMNEICRLPIYRRRPVEKEEEEREKKKAKIE